MVKKQKQANKKKSVPQDNIALQENTFADNVVEGLRQFSVVCRGLYKFSPVLLIFALGYYNFGLLIIYLTVLIGAFSNKAFEG